MQPCVGVEGVCPPLCTYKELKDGTYTLEDVMEFHLVMSELVESKNEQHRKDEERMKQARSKA